MASSVKPTLNARGEIPYRLRIGITGHRHLPDDAVIVEQLGRVLQRIRQIVPSSKYTPVLLGVVSALAQGADQLVAREVLRDLDATLEVVLPMQPDDYITDFVDEVAKRDFQALLAQASDLLVLEPSENREEAYARTGRYVVDRSDILIALWDGQPARGHGGTAEVVGWARERRVPLIWVETQAPYRIHEELGEGIDVRAFHLLDNYNRADVGQTQFDRQVDQMPNDLSTVAEQLGLERNVVRTYGQWISPYFVRADFLARRNQDWFLYLGTLSSVLAALAVVVIALQILPWFHNLKLTLAEVVFMFILLGILFVGRRSKLHEQWIAYRFLAERFRSAAFLAMVGVGGNRKTRRTERYQGLIPEDWLRKAYDDVWNRRPMNDAGEFITEELKKLLIRVWIQGQINYHQLTSHRHERNHRRLTYLTALLFIITLMTGLIHVSGIAGDESTSENILVFFALAMPALATALEGIGAQREHLRNAEQFRRMVSYLEAVKRHVELAPDRGTLRIVAQEAETIMLNENRDWFIGMQFHDLELRV